MEFHLDFDRIGQRTLGITLELDVPAGGVELAQPVWTPGSYLVREYARHLTGFSAADAATGRALPWRKTSKNRYAIEVAAAGRLRVTYSIYAHELTVRTAYVGDDFVFWNGACVFLWPAAEPRREATLRFAPPAGWSVHTSAVVRETERGVELSFGDLDAAVDTPCLVGRVDALEFPFRDKPHSIALAGLAGIRPPDGFVDDVQRLLACAADVFAGELPYERYVFLSLFGDKARGGLEHRDSSTLLAARTTFQQKKSYQDFLGLVAHEFFHVWNVKRMRPRELWEIDYEAENYTELLWVAEGFTAYYDDLLCRRADVLTDTEYLEVLRTHISTVLEWPGRQVQSLAEASFDAWIRLYRPDENTRNSTQNYYTSGALAALCLDAAIRDATDGERSLDDAVRALYESTYGQGRGYDFDDVARCVDEAAGVELPELTQRLAYGTALEEDLESALSRFGLALTRSDEPAPFLGVRFDSEQLRISHVRDHGPAALAGLAPGDEIVGIAGLRATKSNWKNLFAHVAGVGRRLEVLLARQGKLIERTVIPGQNPTNGLKLQPLETATDRQVRLREDWLSLSG